MNRIVTPVLGLIFKKNEDVNKISEYFVDRIGNKLGGSVKYVINGKESHGKITKSKYIEKSGNTKRINPNFSTVKIFTTDNYFIFIGAQSQDDENWLPYIDIREYKASPSKEDYVKQLELYHDIARQYAHRPELERLSITVERLSSSWAPLVPGSHPLEYARLIIRPELLKKNYQNPERFWDAWDQRENIGNKILVSRAMGIVEELEYQRHVYPKIWDLARDAFPGVCKYGVPLFSSEPELKEKELKLFLEGEQCVRLVGYDPEKQIAQATCYVDEGAHIPPHEIFGIRQVITSGKMEDGKPVKTLQIVFPSKEMAMREGVPLLDVGAQVLYLNRQMQDEELTAKDYAQIHAS